LFFILPFKSRSLLDNGISINTNTDVLEVTQNGVNLKNKKTGEEFFCPSDLVVFTAGLKPSVIVGELNLPKDVFGRIKVSRTLQTLKYPEVFALGDCAMVENVSLPSTAQVAMQQSEIVASNLGLRYNLLVNSNSEPKSYMLSKYSYVPLGSMLSLGAKNAAINSLDDNLKLDGLPASVGRRLVYSFRMPTQNQQFTALVSTVSSIIGKSLKKN
jgi:NADH dehydrogenase